ncbi:uncharacterized protein TNCV_507801 [Trichonephila clavipes]|nr:uncharacterized protein TNCV_507801 [Trichonephila clavipes]
MAPGSHCINGNTCGCRISWTYRWLSWCYGSILGVTMYCRQCHLILLHQLWERYVAVKKKAGLRRSPRGLHTRTGLSSLLRLNLDSLLETDWFHSAAVQFSRARHHSKRRHRWMGVKGNTRNGRRNPKCPSARCLRMVREDTGTSSEGDTCEWMEANEAVGCTRAFLTMWWSSRRLVCQGRHEPGLHM